MWKMHRNMEIRRLVLLPIAVMILLIGYLQSALASNCEVTSVGLTPISELQGTYFGEPGGLYPNGVNVPPPFHDSAGISIAKSYTPLNTFGEVDSSGTWVLLSIGLSNTTQEFDDFILNLQSDSTLHPNLAIVDGAQGGQSAGKIKFDTANYWSVVETRLAAKGLSPAQVQACWLKQANPAPTLAFPEHAIVLRNDIRDVLRIMKNRYPNLRQVFMSSRIYAGYASTALNPEPFAYETAFSVRWLIESQINGSDSLNYIPDSGIVASSWLGWGPYLWADGTNPRGSDSLQWFCDDLAADGTHPSSSGQQKVALILEEFFKNSPYTAPWFNEPSPSSGCCDTPGDFNNDGAFNIADVTAGIARIFSGGVAPHCQDEADSNGDSSFNIADVTYGIARIFSGGPAPACP